MLLRSARVQVSSGAGGKIHVPAGQDAPPPPEPAARLVGSEKAAKATPARGLLSAEIGDRALFDETMGPPRSEDPGPETANPPAPAPAKRGRKAKAPA